VRTATAEIWTSLTTVVDGPDRTCLVVDPGITPAEVAAVATVLAAEGRSVVAGFSTHPHWDHVLWSPAWPGATRWAPRAAVESMARTRDADLAKADAAAPGHDPALFGRLTALDPGSDEIPWAGPRALVVPHRAHCPGHAALVLPDARVILVGDMLSDLEIPLLDLDADDPVGDYHDALDLLERTATEHRVEVLVPGHGHVGDRRELDRRLAVDRAYLDALAAGLDPHDARLATPWLAHEHAGHVARLHA
jgi:glyoxylase-like metal-dependent hydrolase (beta-lactamase superfamily II)